MFILILLAESLKGPLNAPFSKFVCLSSNAVLMAPLSWRAAIDTQKFFDAVPHALAVKCLLDVGVPPVVVHTWGAFITQIRRYISIQNSVGSSPISCDRGIPQGDPISMFAAAAALGLWLDSLYKIPAAPSSEAWVFVDDRLLLSRSSPRGCWAQLAFSHTECWDSSWKFITRPKTVCFGFGQLSSALLWSDGSAGTFQVDPLDLAIPLPLRKASRAPFFQPIIEDCCFIFDKMRSAARTLSITARRYIVSSIIQKKLTYSATVIRMTRKQSDRIDA